LWKVNSTQLEKVCTRIPGRRAEMLHFVANRSGVARDPAAKYQIGLKELAASCGWSVLPAERPLPGVSVQPIETSAFFKRAFDAAFLEVATGDEMLMAAQPDVFGRHRLVFSKSTGDWVSFSVHGGTLTGATRLIQANIHRATFVPDPRHFILIQHYEAEKRSWYPWSWLIPSTDFARLARGQGAYLLFTTTLNERRANRWTPYRRPTNAIAGTVLVLLQSSTLRKVA
jgi:hypothetical protein